MTSPISFAQQRLWFLDQLESGTAAYNLPRVIRMKGVLDVAALIKAINAIIARHDSLRTVFTSVEGEPERLVLPRVEPDFTVIELGHLSSNERELEALRIAIEEGRKPFDLGSGPLLRVRLLQLGADEHILVLVMHHIITDGWSMSILFREVAELYDAFASGREPHLAELTLQYSDFAQWQRDYLTSETLATHVDYWKRKLHGADTVLDLPVDHPRPPVHSGHGATKHLFLNSRTTEQLKSLSKREGATLFMTLLATFQTLLWRYTSQDSILVGIPIAGRNELELESVIGFFVNTLILRADFSGDLTFRELLAQVRATALEAYAHQDVPFEKLVEALEPKRTLSHTPLFQVMLVLQNAPKQKFKLTGLVLEEIEFESGIAKFDLTLEAIERDGLNLAFEYNVDLFDEETIERMLGHFKNLIDGIIEDPDLLVSRLPLLTQREREQIIVEWNNTPAVYPKDLCIHTAFEQQAARTPDAVAFMYNDTSLTYRRLNESANGLAHRLIQAGVAPGALVCISVERSLDMAIALLGVLKAGAAYVPLDPSYPKQRAAFTLEDSKASILVTRRGLQNRFAEHATRMIFIDSEQSATDEQSLPNPAVSVSGESLAYVIYTSGSTGMPKGVAGTHRAAMNRFSWMWSAYPFNAGETCCQKTALGFVDSIWEIFGPLLRGIANVIVPEEAVLDPEQLIQVLSKHEVTRIVLIPSLLRALLDHTAELHTRLPKLKLWSSSGEALGVDLARHFHTALPDAKLLNIYGSSEVAADVTWYEVKGTEKTALIPIGRPISNTQIYLIDRNSNPVPVGVRGEIYVGGDCLARGYWDRPELTAAHFLPSFLESGASSRLYKTGDFGRYLPNGDIEYLGRVDNQVKIRGFRVELAEIESVLRSHPLVREVAVVVTRNSNELQLVAYLAPTDGPAPITSELNRFLRSRLPEYMIPSTYMIVDRLPLLPSGKVDRKALLSVASTRSISDRASVGPRTEVEEKLVQIWRDVLHIDQIGIEDNFFDIGGHSLLAIQVVARIRRIFDVEVPVHDLFEHQVIASLAGEVERARASGIKARAPVLARRPPSNASGTREELIARLDKLSPDEVDALLKRMLSEKSS